MSHDYQYLVYNLLNRNQQPILLDPILVEVFYKMIPSDYISDSVKMFDKYTHMASDVYAQYLDPWHDSYIVGSNNLNSFSLHQCEFIDSKHFPIECRRIKLRRKLIDSILQKSSKSFEEELYNFITCLNFNVPQIAPLLNLTFQESTRFLPQFIKTVVIKFGIVNLDHNTIGRDKIRYFGPPEEEGVLPVRIVRGHLSPCTSRSNLLSLNDDIGGAPFTYLNHLAIRQNAIVTLAYNPLENPIITV